MGKDCFHLVTKKIGIPAKQQIKGFNGSDNDSFLQRTRKETFIHHDYLCKTPTYICILDPSFWFEDFHHYTLLSIKHP